MAPTPRIKDVAAHLNVSHQRAAQMYAEGKLPKLQSEGVIRDAVTGIVNDYLGSSHTFAVLPLPLRL